MTGLNAIPIKTTGAYEIPVTTKVNQRLLDIEQTFVCKIEKVYKKKAEKVAETKERKRRPLYFLNSDAFKAILEDRDITTTQLANELEIKRQAIYDKIDKRGRSVKYEMIQKICRFLNVNESQILR